MRKSLEDIKIAVKKDNYKNLPIELEEYNYFIDDGETGNVIMAIPKCYYEGLDDSELDDYECAVPVKYILEHGYSILRKHVVTDVPYNKDYGIEISEQYYEYNQKQAMSVSDKYNHDLNIRERPSEIQVAVERIVKSTIKDNLKVEEKCFFDLIFDKAILLMFFNTPTEKERNEFTSPKQVQLRSHVIDNIIFVIIKVGDLPWCDMAYNPHLSKYFDVSSIFKVLNIKLIDSSCGEEVCNIDLTCNEPFIQKFAEQVNHVARLDFDNSSYLNEIQQIYQVKSSVDLADKAENRN